jgi:hypothetical protein
MAEASTVKVKIGGVERDLEPKHGYEGVCFAITTGKGETGPMKYVALVKVPKGSKYGQKDVFRFARVVDPDKYCKKIYKLPRRVPKNKVGKNEFAKVIAFRDGRRAAIPGWLAGKVAAKKKKVVKGVAKRL